MTLSWLSTFAPAIAVRPTIVFIGVRISWDILERNSVFARFAFFCGPVSLFQCLTGFNLCFLLLCHIHGCQQYLFQLSILPFQGNIRSDFISLFIQAAIFKPYKYHFHFSVFSEYYPGLLRISIAQMVPVSYIFQEPASENHDKIPRGLVYHLAIQIVEFISVIFQITDNKAGQPDAQYSESAAPWKHYPLPSADAVRSLPLPL